jgi:hypothetical protein
MFSRPVEGALFAMLVGLALSCAAHAGVERKHLGDQKYHFRCPSALPACLQHVDDVCRDKSYDVIRGRDRRNYTGVAPVEVEHRFSEAIVQCRPRGTSLGDEALLDAPSATALAAPSAAPRPASVCTPGATQVCVGIGGCTGGQACAADGSAFGALSMRRRCSRPTRLDG